MVGEPEPSNALVTNADETTAHRSRWAAEHWSVRLRDALSTYLPLLLMLLLAGLTWWLVRVAPTPGAPRAAEASPQTPDYVLGGVELVRYRGDGSLMARVRASELRHYPVGDRMELDAAWLLADHPDGAMLAQSERAVLTEDGRRVRLEGDVRLSRAATAVLAAFEMRTASMDLDLQAGRAWTNSPVDWRQDEWVVQAAGFEFVQEGSFLQLKGPVKAQMTPPVPTRR